MSVFFRSAKATLIAIPALIVFYLILFPPTQGQLGETLGWMIIFIMLFSVPIFVVINVFNLLFNFSAEKRSPFRSMAIGATLAGLASFFISGIILPVWAIFVIIGGLLGYIAGATR